MELVISRTNNLENIVHDYFEELMTINSIIHKYTINNIIINKNGCGLLANINFESEEDCRCIALLTRNASTIMYGEYINISSNYINDRTLCINVTKN